MVHKKNKQIAKEWHEAFGTERLKDCYANYLDDDFTSDFFGQKVNKIQYILQYTKFAETFKDNKIVVKEQFAEDDKVVSVMEWTAIHQADTQGMPVKGEAINIKGIAIDYFKNGKVIRHYPLFDTAQLLKREAIREQVRARIARDLHDNIGSTLGSISYYSEMAQQFTREEQLQLKILLQKIEDSSHELVEEMSDMVWAINPANDSFEKLIIRMRNYAVDLFAARNIAFDFAVMDVNESQRLSLEQRKNIFMIYKEVVYNVLKYAECSRFNTSISQQLQTLIIELHDNGKGFDVNQPNAYNGNGIKNMKQRAQEISAALTISSGQGKGTLIRFEVPIK